MRLKRVDARRKYNNRPGDVRCVGGFRSRPSNSSGTKVFLHVNVPIGSEKSNDRTRCAMRTGQWDSGTDLFVDVGDSGEIIGAGGDGGKGRVCDGGYRGKNGNSGLGIAYPGTTTVRVFSGGRIQAGYAGGGGGGGGHEDPDNGKRPRILWWRWWRWSRFTFSGNGGPKGDGAFGKQIMEMLGSNGSKTGGGQGGNGGDQEDQKVEMVEEVDPLVKVQVVVEMVLVMFVTLMELVLEIMVPQLVG